MNWIKSSDKWSIIQIWLLNFNIKLYYPSYISWNAAILWYIIFLLILLTSTFWIGIFESLPWQYVLFLLFQQNVFDYMNIVINLI